MNRETILKGSLDNIIVTTPEGDTLNLPKGINLQLRNRDGKLTIEISIFTIKPKEKAVGLYKITVSE